MKKILKRIGSVVAAVTFLALLVRSGLWVGYLNGCEAPIPVILSPESFASESWVNVPISVPLDSIDEFVNERIPLRMHDRVRKEFNFIKKWKIWINYDIQRGKFISEPINGDLRVKFPLHGKISTSMLSFQFSGVVGGIFTPTLDSDWSLRPDLKYHVEVNKAEFRIGSVPISVKGVVEDALQRTNPKLEEDLNKWISEALKLKEHSSEAWIALHLKKRVVESPESWLVVKPVEIIARRFTTSQDRQISTGLGLRCLLTGVLGEAPEFPTVSPLPVLKVQDDLPSDFRLNLPVEIDPESINESLRNSFQKGVIVSGKHRCRFLNPQVFISGSKLLIQTDFEAESGWFVKRWKGKLTLEGVPSMDPVTNTLMIGSLNYSLKSRDVISKSVDWLLQPAVLGELRKRSSYSFGGDLEIAKNRANKAASHLIDHPRLDFKLQLSLLEANSLDLRNGRIFLKCAAIGNAALSARDKSPE